MANLRMFGEAVEQLDTDTPLTLARVNCFDWTDVCGKQSVTVFPTLRVFQEGKMAWDYSGPQDVQAMYATMKL